MKNQQNEKNWYGVLSLLQKISQKIEKCKLNPKPIVAVST